MNILDCLPKHDVEILESAFCKAAPRNSITCPDPTEIVYWIIDDLRSEIQGTAQEASQVFRQWTNDEHHLAHTRIPRVVTDRKSSNTLHAEIVTLVAEREIVLVRQRLIAESNEDATEHPQLRCTLWQDIAPSIPKGTRSLEIDVRRHQAKTERLSRMLPDGTYYYSEEGKLRIALFEDLGPEFFNKLWEKCRYCHIKNKDVTFSSKW